MKKIILFLLFIFVFLTAKDSWACWTDSADAYCCGDNYCSGCNDQNDCDRYSWTVWQYSYVDVHEYNSSTCCPAYTCATNGNYCTGSDNNDPRAAPASGTCPSGQKCIKCAPNVTCTTLNAGQQVTAGGTINSDGSGCNPLKTCPYPQCTCLITETNKYCSTSGYTSTTGSTGCTSRWCQGTKADVNGIAGVCGTSNNGSFCNAPSSNLCNNTASSVSTSGSTFSWTCYGTAAVCSGTAGSNRSCSATKITAAYASCTGGSCSGSCGQTNGSSCTGGNSCGSTSCYPTCNASCGTSDTGTPDKVTLISPVGTLISPTPYISGATINLSWNQANSLTDSYQIQILNSAEVVPSGTPTSTSGRSSTTSSVSGLINGIYHWRVRAVNSTCASVGVSTTYYGDWSEYGYFVLNSLPEYETLIVENSVGTPVSTTDNLSGRLGNHICQSDFTSDKKVVFVVSGSDPDGVADITSIELKLGNNSYGPVVPTNGVATFIFQYGSPSDANYQISARINDKNSGTSGWIDTNHSFKFWDCKVSVNGTFYDGTDGISCPTTGFATIAPEDVLNLTDFIFTNNNISTSMTINSPANTYSSGSNKLIWGLTYGFSFNTDCSISSTTLRFKDSLASNWQCYNALYTNEANAYDNNPSIIADFSGTLIQDPWWQAQNGGVISNVGVTGEVPVTCTANNCKISFGGLAAAPSINNVGKSLDNSQTWYYSDVLAKLADYNTNYDYFYSQYFVKKGVGTTLAGKTINNISDLGSDTNNIYFINGDLIINGDILKGINKFLMIIVKGNITVNQNVNTVDGIFVANNINASGSNATALTFNGSLYASNSVTFSRDFDTRLNNNTNPAVVVKYDPELIFNLPGDVAKVLTNWQWGN